MRNVFHKGNHFTPFIIHKEREITNRGGHNIAHFDNVIRYKLVPDGLDHFKEAPLQYRVE